MAKRPHILIFNPDQWRGDVLGHMGDPAAVTPNLDAIVETDAVSFSNAFCQNTVCTPSRCSFMTGWYPHTRGHRTMHYMLEKNEPCLLKKLKDDGYFVWWGGKNDLVPGQNGYDDFCDIKHKPDTPPEPMWMTNIEDQWRGDPNGDNYYSFYVGQLPITNTRHYHDKDWEDVEAAIDFINSYDGDKPLCIYLPLTYPHPPYAVEEPWFSMIDRDSLPKRIPSEFVDTKNSILKGIADRQNLKTLTEQRWNEIRAVYYGMCARVDHQFGMVTDALKQKQIYDDTAIFFFADHGEYNGDFGIVEKTQNTFEDSLSKVPLIVKPPKDTPTKPGINHSLVELIDFTATAYQLSQTDPGYTHFGKSLLGLIDGTETELRDAVFTQGGRNVGETQATESGRPEGDRYWPRTGLQEIDDENHYHDKSVMCRTKNFKYVYRLNQPDQLYDLINDPSETINLIDSDKHKDILWQLKERLLRWYAETSDVVPMQLDKRD